MNEEIRIPKFVTDLTNYLIAIKNLSQIYVKNMTITTEPFKKINSERKIEKKLPNYLSLDEAFII